LARRSVSGDFRSITPHCSRVILIEAGPRLLPSFPDALSAKALAATAQLGVEVRTGVPVTAVAADHVMVGGERIPAHSAIWAAGVQASAAARWLDAPADRAGRVIVGADLRVPGHPAIFVIGDTAACAG